MQTPHKDRLHAVLSASGAERWINCPPSARLEAEQPDRKSRAADEGTLAHELGELMIRQKTGSIEASFYKARVKEIQKNELYHPEMWEYIESYSDFVIEQFNEANVNGGATLLLEQKLDLTAFIPEGFGTGDVIIISNGKLRIIDLKYGKGVPVSAVKNSQMRVYGLGALHYWDMLYSIHTVEMTIVQPRLDDITTDVMSAEALNEWSETVLKPAASLAFKGEGEFSPGKHCQFCRIRSVCKANYDEQMKILKTEHRPDIVSAEEKTFMLTRPEFITPEDVTDILTRQDSFKKWVTGVTEFALEQALAGIRWPGFKLVEGRSNRTITDVEKAAVLLLEAGYKEEQIYTPKELQGITKLEAEIGKATFKTLLDDLIMKPAGKPTLAPEDDKRPEFNSSDSDFPDDAEDFK